MIASDTFKSHALSVSLTHCKEISCVNTATMVSNWFSKHDSSQALTTTATTIALVLLSQKQVQA